MVRFHHHPLMSPLRIEAFHSSKGWSEIGIIGPHDPFGSISDNLPSGHRDIFIFFCSPDDKYSVIKILPEGFDLTLNYFRNISLENLKEAKEIKRLTLGSGSYEMKIKTDISPIERKIRFTHINSSKQK